MKRKGTSRIRGFALRSAARVLGVVAATIPLSSCYLLSQGASLFRYQAAAEPIDEILQRGALADGTGLSSDTRAFLSEVERVREFAVSLGLASTDNYTSLVPTEKDHLVDVVNATGRLSFERHEWWWPLVGRLPYKGYYDREDAERLATRLRERGLDVWVRPVGAFSTLGILRDPLYEFMANYDRHTIASLIIHESAHATLFLRGHAQFNEEFATFVGDEGADEYLRSIAAPPEELELVRDRAVDRETIRGLILGLRGELELVYSSDSDDSVKLREKQRIIRAFQERVRTEYESIFRTESYRNLADIPINNAFIDLYVAYTEDLGLFRNLFDSVGGDMSTFIDRLSVLDSPRTIPDKRLRQLARRDPKAWITEALLDSPNSRP